MRVGPAGGAHSDAPLNCLHCSALLHASFCTVWPLQRTPRTDAMQLEYLLCGYSI